MKTAKCTTHQQWIALAGGIAEAMETELEIISAVGFDGLAKLVPGAVETDGFGIVDDPPPAYFQFLADNIGEE